MTITSKFALTALLVGIAVPALAQGSVTNAATPKAPAHHAPLLHKVSSPVEAAKPTGTVTATTPAKIGIVKPDIAKTDAAKPGATPALTKTPAPAAAPATVQPKTN